jgi:hypothetical protein
MIWAASHLEVAEIKTGHCDFQNRPVGSEVRQYTNLCDERGRQPRRPQAHERTVELGQPMDSCDGHGTGPCKSDIGGLT